MFNGKYSSLVVSMLDSEVRDLCWRPGWVNVLYPWTKHLIILSLSLSLSLSSQEYRKALVNYQRSLMKYWGVTLG